MVAGLTLIASGCAREEPATRTPADSENKAEAGACEPSGTQLSISAKDIKFDEECLAAPAGEPFTVTFDNQEQGIPHNVAIYTDESAQQKLFAGENFNGPAIKEYLVPALEPGTYLFRCDVHPTEMTGKFVVK